MRSAGVREADRGVGSGARRYRLPRPSHEFDVNEPPGTTSHAELRSIRDRPLGAQIEGGAPSSFIEGKELYPHFHVASGAVGSHAPLPCLSRALRSRPVSQERSAGRVYRVYPPRLKYCTARSCFSAAPRDAKVPRLRRCPVFGSFFFESSR